MKELPKRTGAGSYPDCWGWQGVTLDGHRVEVNHYWGWDLRVELTTEQHKDRKLEKDKSWFYLVKKDRDAAMHLFGQLTGLTYEKGIWYDRESKVSTTR